MKFFSSCGMTVKQSKHDLNINLKMQSKVKFRPLLQKLYLTSYTSLLLGSYDTQTLSDDVVTTTASFICCQVVKAYS